MNTVSMIYLHVLKHAICRDLFLCRISVCKVSQAVNVIKRIIIIIKYPIKIQFNNCALLLQTKAMLC